VGHRDDRGRIETALAALCRDGRPFNATDVDRLILDADPRPYARLVLASMMAAWSRRGDMVADYSRPPAQATRRSRHAARLGWWRGAASSAVEAA
jgi:hypothetical protein